ncbi:MAG: glutaredoxin domain-containing protein [Campylobacterota bacterium]|nr:glutaredoxin domain-containing protein [Campylobacterota bacterium]
MAFFSRVFLPFLLLAYIATETYMKLQHTSLCGEVGCKLAGELLNFDSIYLNYFGMAGVLILIILGLFSLKNAFSKTLFFTVLYAAIAFEATILMYQFIANPEPCIFCLGIFSSLLVIALVSGPKKFLLPLAIVLSIAVALSTLAINKNQSYVIENGTYLIQSETCSHCKKVKSYFADHNIDYKTISAKEVNARSFLKFINIQTIPVLVLKTAHDIKIIQGDKRIIGYYEQKSSIVDVSAKTTNTAVPSSSASYNPMGNDFLTAGANDGGCALTVVEAEPCDTNTSH